MVVVTLACPSMRPRVGRSRPASRLCVANAWRLCRYRHRRHVLTGYGMDEAGEAGLLAFNLGQVPNFGMALIVAASAAVGPKDARFSFPRYLLQAWRRGRGTPMLSTAPYERLLATPLDDVRQLLGIPRVRAAHPQGIIVGNRVRGSNRWTFVASVQ